MARAGFCRECAANVWLTPEGGCPAGHPAESVSGEYEAEILPTPPLTAASSPEPKRRRRTAVIVSAIVVVVLGLCAAVAALAVPALSQGAALTGEWKARLAEDYPEWQAAGFNVRTYSGDGESETEYSFTMIPPDRDFAIGVVYVASGDASAQCQDEIFRPDGRYHDRAESLLDYVEDHYVNSGKAVTSVASDSSGLVRVSWVKESRVGMLSSRVGSYDELEYDSSSDTWSVGYSAGE